MNGPTRTAMMLGVFGTIALGSTTASQAADPAFAYTGDPAYAYSRGYDPGFAYSPGYASYAYAPGFAYSRGYQSYAYAPGYRHRYHRRYGYGYDASTHSVPRHYDPGEGYNSNTVAPWQDWKYQGRDY